MKTGIIGLGYVGLPLAVAIAEEGHEVVCVDTDQRKLAALERGESYIEDITSERLQAVAELLHPTSRYADLASVEVVVIAVPTPLTENREPDLGPLVGSATSLAGVLQQGQLVVLESTTYPGTTRERLVPLLEESGLAAGQRLPRRLLARADRPRPHRLDAAQHAQGGRRAHRRLPRPRGRAFYSQVCDEIVEVSAPEEAELTKLLENVFRSVNIALVNELAILCDRMGIDIWEVVDAANTKPYGFMSLPPRARAWAATACRSTRSTWPGRRASTTCPPPSSSWPARSTRRCPTSAWSGWRARSTATPSRCAGSRVAIVGVSYKPGVGDLRESPGAEDHAAAGRGRRRPRLPRRDRARAARLRPALASRWRRRWTGADVVVIVTAHPGLDIDLILSEAPLVVDFRGVTRGKRSAEPRTPVSAVAGRGRRPRLLGPQPRPQLRPPARRPTCAGSATPPRSAASAGRPSFPARRPTADLDELLADPEIDAVVLATHVPTHADLAVRVLEAGKHCFVEKPLAQSAADAERVVEAAEAAGRVLMVGPPARVPPRAWRSCASWSAGGGLGDVRYLYSNRLNLGQLRADENALWSLGAHDVSVVLRLVDEDPSSAARWARATCARGSRTWCSATCASPRAWPRTCTSPGSTRTRSGASRWSARSRWPPSTTWSWTRRSRSTTRASTRASSPTASTSPARAT